jgi:hypothetical protein
MPHEPTPTMLLVVMLLRLRRPVVVVDLSLLLLRRRGRPLVVVDDLARRRLRPKLHQFVVVVLGATLATLVEVLAAHNHFSAHVYAFLSVVAVRPPSLRRPPRHTDGLPSPR